MWSLFVFVPPPQEGPGSLQRLVYVFVDPVPVTVRPGQTSTGCPEQFPPTAGLPLICWQLFEKPSFSVLLPSSQASFVSTCPSPQNACVFSLRLATYFPAEPEAPSMTRKYSFLVWTFTRRDVVLFGF